MNAEFGQKDDETLVYEERVSCDGGQLGHPKIFLSVCYLIFTLLFVVTGIKLDFNYYFFVGAMAVLFHLLVIQIMSFNKEDKGKCLKIFKSNNVLGLITLICILIGKLN